MQDKYRLSKEGYQEELHAPLRDDYVPSTDILKHGYPLQIVLTPLCISER